ncbi:MAG TPA: hypothetical protein VLL76_00180, partial [Candidatus Omnitrophota bacterium]|nr:hypothetical protein [Candidatus Omnitrophota bacterium]
MTMEVKAASFKVAYVIPPIQTYGGKTVNEPGLLPSIGGGMLGSGVGAITGPIGSHMGSKSIIEDPDLSPAQRQFLEMHPPHSGAAAPFWGGALGTLAGGLGGIALDQLIPGGSNIPLVA